MRAILVIISVSNLKVNILTDQYISINTSMAVTVKWSVHFCINTSKSVMAQWLTPASYSEALWSKPQPRDLLT